MAAVAFLFKVLLILFAVFAYYLWIPLPDDLDQKGMARSVGLTIRLISLFTWLRSVFSGGFSEVDVVRNLGRFAVSPPDLDSDPLIQVNNDIFNGIAVRVYRPKGVPVPSPVLMYIHGGGFCTGSIDSDDMHVRYLVKLAKVSVVSVKYRLAPEHPFPAGLDDCVAATLHVLENGQQLGFDTKRVGVAGMSAGGNLAAAISLRLLDEEFQNRGLPKLKYQVMILPTLQGVDFNLPSYVNNDEISSFIITRRSMATFFQVYAGLDNSYATTQQIMKGQHIRDKTRSDLAKYIHSDLIEESKNEIVDGGTVNETLASLAEPILLNHRLSPLLAPDNLLKQLPPAFTVISHYDILRDDAVLYVRRLQQAGAEVTSHMIENGHHLSMFMFNLKPGSENVEQAFDKLTQFIKNHNKF